MLADCHMHTHLCGHAQGEPTEYVRAAAERGIDLITVTCHIPMPGKGFGQRGIRMRAEQLAEYRSMVSEAQDLGRELGVTVLYGIEAEVFPRESELVAMDLILEEQQFDFVLGSLHHPLSIYRSLLRSEGTHTQDAIVGKYFEDLATGAESGRYHSLAHPDLIRIYGTVDPFDPVEYEEEIKRFLVRVRDAGVALEVNTSGFTKELSEIHPAPVIVKWAAELGVCFTLGSDAHRPRSVGQFFDDAVRLLGQYGVRQHRYYCSGEPVICDLPMVEAGRA